MRKSLILIFGLVLAWMTLLPGGYVKAEEQEIKVYLQGERIKFDTPPVMVKGTTMVQFRPIFEKLGLKVEWDANSRRIKGTRGNTLVVDMVLDNANVFANNRNLTLDVAPTLIGEYTMVPLRFLGEASGKMVNWRQSDRTIWITNGFELDSSISNPYGNDGFIELKDINNHQNIKPEVYQDKNGYLYVSWSEDFSIDQFQGSTTFASIAKNGAWLERSAVVTSVSKQNGYPYQSFFIDGAYYVRSGSLVNRITLNPSGYTSGDIVASNLSSTVNYNEVIRPVLVNGGRVAILYKYSNGTATEWRLYAGDTSNSYTVVHDVYKILDNLSQTSSLTYDFSTKMMSIIEDNAYRQLNIESGDLKYGSDGKDLVVKLYDAQSWSTQRYLYNGSFYCLYLDGSNDTYRYVKLDSNLKASDPIITQIKREDLQGKSVTFTDNSIRLWSVYEFNRKPSVQFIQYTK